MRFSDLPFRSVLGSRNFALLWSGQTLSELGNHVSTLAWIWLLTDLTGSTSIIGTVLAAYTVPTILLLVVAGTLVDRTSPRRIALIAELSNALLGGLFAVLVTLDKITISQFIVIAIVFGTIQAFSNPAYGALFPSVVDRERYNAANSAWQLSAQVAALIGAPIGGFLISRWSVGVALAFDALTFAAAAVAIFLIHVHGGANAQEDAPETSGDQTEVTPSWITSIREGTTFVLSQRGMLAVVLLFALSNALNNVETVLVPVLARSEFNASPESYGFLATFSAVGAMAGALLVGVVGSRVRQPATLVCAMIAVVGLGILLMGYAQGLVHLYAAFLILGCAFVVPEILTVTLWQRIIPANLRGRVFGLLGMLAMIANPAGYLLAGFWGDVVGVRPGLRINGALILVLAIVAFSLPSVRRLNRYTPDELSPAGDIQS